LSGLRLRLNDQITPLDLIRTGPHVEVSEQGFSDAGPNPLLAIPQSSQCFLLLLCYHERHTRPGTLNLRGCHRLINEFDLAAESVRPEGLVADRLSAWRPLSAQDFLCAGDDVLLARAS
jgi:hypothetical protein